MNDSQHPGLGELGQRVQAMSDPAPDTRLRPYQGAPLPVGPTANGRPTAPYEGLEEFRVTPVPHSASSSSSPAPYTSRSFQPPVAAPATTPALAAASTPIASPVASPISNQEPLPAWEHATPYGAASEAAPGPGSGLGTDPAPPATALPSSTPSAPPPNPSAAPKSGLQRAIDAVRSAIPVVQRLLPLLDGNIATAVGALVAPHHHPTPPPQVQVDLEPIERGLAEVRNSHRELRGQVLEQVTSLKRVEDQLERVREATDRNTLEQQELVEDLRSMGNRVVTFAIVGVVLLVLSLGVNIYLILQMQHILR